MTPPPIPWDTHIHTPLCKHARGDPQEYAQQAVDRGLSGIAFTCHNPDPDWAPEVRMEPDELPRYVEWIQETKIRFADQLDVRMGLECDVVYGREQWVEELRGQAPFDYFIGSVHCQLAPYLHRFQTQTNADFIETYFENLAYAAETGLIDALAHPDLLKVLLGNAWDPEAFRRYWEPALDRIAKTNVAMEMNTSGIRKKCGEAFPDPTLLHAMSRRDIPVVVGSDAHTPEHVAAGFEEACDQLWQAGYRNIWVFRDHRGESIELPKDRDTLAVQTVSPFRNGAPPRA